MSSRQIIDSGRIVPRIERLLIGTSVVSESADVRNCCFRCVWLSSVLIFRKLLPEYAIAKKNTPVRYSLFIASSLFSVIVSSTDAAFSTSVGLFTSISCAMYVRYLRWPNTRLARGMGVFRMPSAA